MPRRGQRKALPSRLPAVYDAGFPWRLDKRSTIGRQVGADVWTLFQDLGGIESLSVQQRMLCERAVFLRRRLLVHEEAVLAGQPPVMTANEHTAAVNALLGVLKALGLKRQARDVGDLRTYLAAAVNEGADDAADDAA